MEWDNNGMGWDKSRPMGWDGTGTKTPGMGRDWDRKNIFSWDGTGTQIENKIGMGWDASHPIYIPGPDGGYYYGGAGYNINPPDRRHGSPHCFEVEM